MRETVGQKNIDEALTSGKGIIQTEAQDRLQEIFRLLRIRHPNRYRKNYKMSILLPERLTTPLKTSLTHSKIKERAINEAKGYQNDILPKARGVAAQMINEAEAYQVSLIKDAEGESKRFLALLREYRQAKYVTRKRLYLETMERILPKADKIVLGGSSQRNVLPYLPLRNPNSSRR